MSSFQFCWNEFSNNLFILTGLLNILSLGSRKGLLNDRSFGAQDLFLFGFIFFFGDFGIYNVEIFFIIKKI